MHGRCCVLFNCGVAAALLLCGCEKTKGGKETRTGSKEVTVKLTVSSAAFGPAKPIPKKHAYKGEGQNLSPPLSWSGAPGGTKTFAIVCDDPDAPSPKRPRPDPWVHWVVYDIAADRTALAEGETGGGVLGKTDFGETAWGGPMPPPGSGTHRYFFRVYALDTRLELPAGATKQQLLKAMQGHILAEGELHGTYERN